MTDGPLAGLSVVDLSLGIAGGYAAKLLGDAGGEVVKVIDAAGDPLARRASRHGGGEYPLFTHLHAGHERVVVNRSAPNWRRQIEELVAGADIVLDGADTATASPLTGGREPVRPNRRHVTVSITPFGQTGPWRDRAANEFTLQGWSGKLRVNYGGDGGRAPVAAGGEAGLWLCGAFAALGAVAFHRVADRLGRAVHVDTSTLEALASVFGQDAVAWQLEGRPDRVPTGSARELPGIHATADGVVAFAVVSAQQWFDFCVMIERPEWVDDPELVSSAGRKRRASEVLPAIEQWLAPRSTLEVLDLAAMWRIPAGTVTDGESITHLPCYEDSFTNDIGFVRPRPLLRCTPFRASPAAASDSTQAGGDNRPLRGRRIVDFTAYWAGPYAASIMALLGADVIHVESPKRPDGMRMRSARPPTYPDWLEYSALYHVNNASKRAVSIDMDHPDGLELAKQLVAVSDGVIENFSPRVMDRFGLDASGVEALNPSAVYVRMPAFGLDNPWRDRLAFQHTIEPIAGIAGITGYPDGEPQPIMICDGLGGVHAAFAMLCGLHGRDFGGGAGMHIEVRLSEVAANIAAEQIVVASARGETMRRIGNRHRWAGPQGVFRCRADRDSAGEWVAVSVDTDEQWRHLCDTVDRLAPWRTASIEERRCDVEAVEAVLAEWCGAHTPDAVAAALDAASVPFGRLCDGRGLLDNPQLAYRSYYTAQTHPRCGLIDYPGLPFVAQVEGSGTVPTGHCAPAPLWGEHDDELASIIDADPARIAELEHLGIVGPGDANPAPM